MKVRGFGAWPSRNVFKGGQRNSYDEYNKTLKGTEKFPEAEEYASRYVEEYHHYQEQQDLTVEQDDEQKKKERKKKEQKKRRQSMIQRAVVLVAGSIVIATSYQVMAAKRAQQGDSNNSAVETIPGDDGTDDSDNPQPTQDTTTDATASTEQGTTGQSTTASWRWSADGKSAVLIITDSSGNVLAEVKSTVTTTEEPAKCTTEGRLTYTASASWEGQEYTDTRFETLPALGHSFDNGTATTLDDGSTATDFECTRCHEHFIIKNSTTEE